jgi:hypothetical protein
MTATALAPDKAPYAIPGVVPGFAPEGLPGAAFGWEGVIGRPPFFWHARQMLRSGMSFRCTFSSSVH